MNEVPSTLPTLIDCRFDCLTTNAVAGDEAIAAGCEVERLIVIPIDWLQRLNRTQNL